MDKSLIELLKDIGARAVNSEYACRVTVEEQGVRINMWTRQGDYYADRNYIIGWTELEHFDSTHVSTTFEMLNRYIKRRLVDKLHQAIKDQNNGN